MGPGAPARPLLPDWWVKPPIRGESTPLQQSTGTSDKRRAREAHDRLAQSRWKQDRVCARARHSWEEAVVRWLLEAKHKATHGERSQPARSIKGRGASCA